MSIEVGSPHAVRRAALANGEGTPLTVARGDVHGRHGVFVATRARLELQVEGAEAASLDLGDWTAEGRGAQLPVSPGTEAWRFTLQTEQGEVAAEMIHDMKRGSLRGGALRYWQLKGAGTTWCWGVGASRDDEKRPELRLWRGEPEGEPVVALGVTQVKQERNVESVVAAVIDVEAGQASATEEAMALLLAVGGFSVELVGRNERIKRIAKWWADAAVEDFFTFKPGDVAY